MFKKKPEIKKKYRSEECDYFLAKNNIKSINLKKGN